MRTGGGKPGKGTALAKNDSENAQRIAEKVQYLFEYYRKSDGERYTAADIERASGGKLKYMWTWQLSRAEKWRPAIEDLIELAKVFGCDPEIWVISLDEWKKREQAVKEQAEQDSETLHTIALRSMNLTAPGQKIVLDMIESLERSGFTTKRSKKKLIDEGS